MVTSNAKDRLTLILFVFVGLILVYGLAANHNKAFGQSGGGFNLAWFTVDGGGGMNSAGGGYSLNGTAGQPEVGAPMTGGSYRVVGGFWTVKALQENKVFLPLLIH